MDTCIEEGCYKPIRVKKRQMCSSHYQMWARRNRPLGKKSCSIEDCSNQASTRGWCSNHYSKWRRYGDPLGEYVKPQCSEDDCFETSIGRGLCARHYQRWYYYNVEGTGIDQFDQGHWKVKPDDEIGYAAAHYRVRRQRGFARQYPCVDCGMPAKDWALRHDGSIRVDGRPGRTKGALFSTNVDDYQPMCDDCHRAYDAIHKNTKRRYKT